MTSRTPCSFWLHRRRSTSPVPNLPSMVAFRPDARRLLTVIQGVSMRFVNVSGRAGLVVPGGYLDVEESSGGRFPSDPHGVLQQWSAFVEAAPDLRGPGRPLD